jgi:hypothetical protein
MSTNVTPLVMPKKRVQSLKSLRGYGLGKRSPKTLPEVRQDSETREQARTANIRWSRLRKQVQAGRTIGHTYS